mmetsp:Transcript_21421/g.43431  ORF Transcript_21421/g.43431 Transcript_21421/m.43431 type:complete len:203 (-) Transcript_21421:35-643(-)|eukprot:CAMPEP_0181316208 /NCGR_PEP_ID=MMETSP1101-20121128/15774_1 /TAXON_ID=46948 /ORGANISM="Rhodomonas abbreviata, Strain Caron Lab Isolate" /LENGTH=202 /DNA_ID=CAMNT_0023423443 /DNA_START=24 /DNA_END=632 /DNA_ORIENTATION=-
MVRYTTFEAGQPVARSYRFLAPLAAVWAFLVVSAVLFVANQSEARTGLLQIIEPGQVLAFKPYEPERNVFENFDADGPGLDYAWKHEYDLANEADYNQININSGADDSGSVTQGIPDPYFVSHGLTVPDAVYDQDPPYALNVVELGEPTLGRPFKEYVPEEAVMGKAYEDHVFDATLQSVPEHNPMREWIPVEGEGIVDDAR